MKKKAYYNILFSIISQVVSIISGLIVPRLMLISFGSEANGLLSSLTQFLNYISLLEGGLGSVVLASLYSPLAKKNYLMLNRVLNAANSFFKKIAYIFVIYVIGLGILYPRIIKSTFTDFYIFSLTIILAISLFIQYFFSITYKLLLQADQKMYLIQGVQIIASILNVLLIYITIKIYPHLHIVKLLSSLVYALQPIFYVKYVKKHYLIDRTIKPSKEALAQRWDCFGQNLAFFIHNNTDTVILSLFTNLKFVSVYAIYFLVVNNLKNFLMSFSNAFTPMIGFHIAENNKEKIHEIIDLYEFIIINVSTFIFGSCIYLLPSFVLIYTHGVKDANYYQPLFSIFLILAEYMYCIRDPYTAVIYSAGEFKETSASAYIEAGLNIIISLILVFPLGLIGIALGTLISISYRTIYQVWYISKNITKRPMKKFFFRIFLSFLMILVSLKSIFILESQRIPSNFYDWVKYAFIGSVIYIIIMLGVNFIFDKRWLKRILKHKK